jgi:hypothetical protein
VVLGIYNGEITAEQSADLHEACNLIYDDLGESDFASRDDAELAIYGMVSSGVGLARRGSIDSIIEIEVDSDDEIEAHIARLQKDGWHVERI